MRKVFALSMMMTGFAISETTACSPAIPPVDVVRATCPVHDKAWIPHSNGCAGWGEPIYLSALDYVSGSLPQMCEGGFPVHRNFSDPEKQRLKALVSNGTYERETKGIGVYERTLWVADALGDTLDPEFKFQMQLATPITKLVASRPPRELRAFAENLIASLESGELAFADSRRRNSALRVLTLAGSADEARSIYLSEKPAWVDHPAFLTDVSAHHSLEFCMNGPARLRQVLCHPQGIAGFAQRIITCLNPEAKRWCESVTDGLPSDRNLLVAEVRHLADILPNFREQFSFALSYVLPRRWETFVACLDQGNAVAACEATTSKYEKPKVLGVYEHLRGELLQATTSLKSPSLRNVDGTCPVEAVFPSIPIKSGNTIANCTLSAVRNISFNNARCLMGVECKHGYPVDLSRLSTVGIDPTPFIAFQKFGQKNALNRNLEQLAKCQVERIANSEKPNCFERSAEIEQRLRRELPEFEARMKQAYLRALQDKVARLATGYVSNRAWRQRTDINVRTMTSLLASHPEQTSFARIQYERAAVLYGWPWPYNGD